MISAEEAIERLKKGNEQYVAIDPEGKGMNENIVKNRIHVILVGEPLGF